MLYSQKSEFKDKNEFVFNISTKDELEKNVKDLNFIICVYVKK